MQSLVQTYKTPIPDAMRLSTAEEFFRFVADHVLTHSQSASPFDSSVFCQIPMVESKLAVANVCPDGDHPIERTALR